MQYLIDPNITTQWQFCNLPLLFSYKIKTLGFLKRKTWGFPRLNKKLFSLDKFSGIEFVIPNMCLFKKNLDIDWEKIAKIKRKNWNIKSFHGCYSDQIPTKEYSELNLTKYNLNTKKHFENNLKIIEEISRDNIKNPIAIFHCGHVEGISIKKGMQNVIENIKNVIDFAKENKIILTIENLYHYTEKNKCIGVNAAELKEILNQVKSRYLKITFDWGHANAFASDYLKKEEDKKTFQFQNDFIKELNKDIVHAHIHYNKAHDKEYVKKIKSKIKRDEHLPLTRIPSDEFSYFKESIKTLARKTNTDKATFEMPQEKAFWFLPIHEKGAKFHELIQSVEIMDKILGKKNKK